MLPEEEKNLIEMVQKIDTRTQLTNQTLEFMSEQKNDHEERIRKMEKRWYTSWAALTLALGTAIKEILKH